MIAVIALVHGLVVATRIIGALVPLRVECPNPWDLVPGFPAG